MLNLFERRDYFKEIVSAIQEFTYELLFWLSFFLATYLTLFVALLYGQFCPYFLFVEIYNGNIITPFLTLFFLNVSCYF